MFSIQDAVLPPGSVILVTGVSGFIAGHIADQLLAAGYFVRGTTRNVAKNSWMNLLFHGKYGEGKFDLFAIDDMGKPNAFDAALKGISGVIHAASDMSFRPDPNEVIPPMVSGTLNLLDAAARHPEVKRVVLTSSCLAAASPELGVGRTINKNTWNETAIRQAWAPPPYDQSRGFIVYAASKAQSEKDAWKWYEDHNPQFVLNAVLPGMNFGQSLDLKNQGHASTSGLLQALFNSDLVTVSNGAEYFFIDVQDDARLHVAALIHPNIRQERVFAYNQPYTWRGIQQLLRELYPLKTFAPEAPDAVLDTSEIIHAPRAEALLKEMGQPGFTTLEECVRKNTEDLVY